MRSAKLTGLAVVVGLLAISTFGIHSSGAQGSADLSAQEVLARLAMTYAHCTSYQDAGVVRIVYLESGRSRIEERPFRTAFVRPDSFRFEYTETGLFGAKRRYIVCRVGTRVQTWWDVKPGVEEKESLGSALGAATGVSGGSAHAIPALLLPREVEGRRLTDMTDAKRLADAKVGSADCFRVEGKYANSPRVVWVDQKTFLVRRIDFEDTLPTFRTQQTTTYEAVIDEQVAPDLLRFDPPAQR
jgi:outer membrane lipoprotein-sorting protein